jgi:hypothetical protein
MRRRARRAVLAVTGTAEGMFGGRFRRSGRDRPPPANPAPAPRPEPTAGLPPRIERAPTAGLPPRIERAPTAGLPPRIERAPVVEAPAQRTPDPVAPEPAAPVRQWDPPRVQRTPRRAEMRAHLWLTSIVCVALAVGLGGYWVLRVHQRIGQAALQHEVGKRESAHTVGCSKLQADGAVWACAIVYQAESECLIAKVNVIGSWSIAVGQHRCAQIPALVKLLPGAPTAAGVAADIDRMSATTGTQCLKEPNHKVRWACQEPPPGKACVVVRVQVWTAFNTTEGGTLCSKLPGLVKKVQAAHA